MVYALINVKPAREGGRGKGRLGIGLGFDIFQKIAVKFHTPGCHRLDTDRCIHLQSGSKLIGVISLITVHKTNNSSCGERLHLEEW